MTNIELLRANPFDSLRQMRTLTDRARYPRSYAPDIASPIENLALDVYDRNGDLVVKAAVPGIKPENVKVTITEGLLEIHAESNEETEVREAAYYLKEYTANTFHRSLRLPGNISADRATAKFANGFLTLTIPRSAGTTARSIDVKVA